MYPTVSSVRRLVLVLAESSLEVVPKEILNHPTIIRDARRRGVDPRYVILDRARHHTAMRSLPSSSKRGRPDIVHGALLLVQNSSLNRAGLLRMYIHTINDLVITVDPRMRPPRNYNNFIGLMMQLMSHGRVPPWGEPLMVVMNGGLRRIIELENPSRVYLLDDVRGAGMGMDDFVYSVVNEDNPMVMVGGFPHGEFSVATYSVASDVVKLGNTIMDTAWVLCRIITLIEYTLGIVR